jgi:hypothetical protein
VQNVGVNSARFAAFFIASPPCIWSLESEEPCNSEWPRHRGAKTCRLTTRVATATSNSTLLPRYAQASRTWVASVNFHTGTKNGATRGRRHDNTYSLATVWADVMALPWRCRSGSPTRIEPGTCGLTVRQAQCQNKPIKH